MHSSMPEENGTTKKTGFWQFGTSRTHLIFCGYKPIDPEELSLSKVTCINFEGLNNDTTHFFHLKTIDFMLLRFALMAVLALNLAPALPAQVNMVTEMDKPMSFGTRPGFSVSFPNTDRRLVDDVWSDFVKNNFSSKLKKGKKGEKTASGCRSVSVSAGDFTLYSEVEKIGDGAQLNVWFDLGPTFLHRNDDSRRTEDTKKLLTNFYFDVRRAVVGQEVKSEEDRLSDLDKKLSKLQRDNTNLLRDIENYKEKLKKAEEDLVQNQKDQDTTIKDIEQQRKAVEDARLRQGNVENERQ